MSLLTLALFVGSYSLWRYSGGTQGEDISIHLFINRLGPLLIHGQPLRFNSEERHSVSGFFDVIDLQYDLINNKFYIVYILNGELWLSEAASPREWTTPRRIAHYPEPLWGCKIAKGTRSPVVVARTGLADFTVYGIGPMEISQSFRIGWIPALQPRPTDWETPILPPLPEHLMANALHWVGFDVAFNEERGLILALVDGGNMRSEVPPQPSRGPGPGFEVLDHARVNLLCTVDFKRWERLMTIPISPPPRLPVGVALCPLSEDEIAVAVSKSVSIINMRHKRIETTITCSHIHPRTSNLSIAPGYFADEVLFVGPDPNRPDRLTENHLQVGLVRLKKPGQRGPISVFGTQALNLDVQISVPVVRTEGGKWLLAYHPLSWKEYGHTGGTTMLEPVYGDLQLAEVVADVCVNSHYNR
jgi:hypothetical protein